MVVVVVEVKAHVEEASHAVGRDGHRPLVDGRRYPRETSPLRDRLRILPRTGRHLIVLRQRHGPVTIDPRPRELHVRHTVAGAVRLVVPQKILQLLHHLALVLQMADLLQNLLQQRVHLGRRGLKGPGGLHPSPVPVVLNAAVRALPRQTLPGRALPGETARRTGGGRAEWRGCRSLTCWIQERVRLDARPLSSLSAVPRVATAHGTLTRFRDDGRRLAQAAGRWFPETVPDGSPLQGASLRAGVAVAGGLAARGSSRDVAVLADDGIGAGGPVPGGGSHAPRGRGTQRAGWAYAGLAEARLDALRLHAGPLFRLGFHGLLCNRRTGNRLG